MIYAFLKEFSFFHHRVRSVHFESNVTDTSRHINRQTLNDRMPKNSLRAVLLVRRVFGFVREPFTPLFANKASKINSVVRRCTPVTQGSLLIAAQLLEGTSRSECSF